MMVTGPGCLLTCPIVNFQAVSSTGFGLVTPKRTFQDRPSRRRRLCFRIPISALRSFVGKPMGFNGRVVFQSGQRDRHTDVCGNISLGCTFRYVEVCSGRFSHRYTFAAAEITPSGSIYAARPPAEEEQRNRYQTYRVIAGIKNHFMDLAGCYDIIASLFRQWRALRGSIKQLLPRWL